MPAKGRAFRVGQEPILFGDIGFNGRWCRSERLRVA